MKIEKPIIPEHVAKWIEINQEKEKTERQVVTHVFHNHISSSTDDTYEWVQENLGDFIIAYRYGFDVE